MKRIYAFDLAKGFTVFVMPGIHLLMLCGDDSVMNCKMTKVLAWIAENIGAQVFMLLMGVGVVWSSKAQIGRAIKRALIFLLLGYGLNFVKFCLPLFFNVLPSQFIIDLGIQEYDHLQAYYFRIGDIMHFAAIGYFITYLVNRSKYASGIALVLILLITFISPILWDIKTGVESIDILLSLFIGHPPYCFFPVFPWLVYPLAGLILGDLLIRQPHDKVLLQVAVVSVILIITTSSIPDPVKEINWLSFYRTEPADTFYHLGVVLCWLSFAHLVARFLKPFYITKVLVFCSKHITMLYCIQWILAFTAMITISYKGIDLTGTIVFMLLTTIMTLISSYLINTLCNKKYTI
jgi:hypothetical protein